MLRFVDLPRMSPKELRKALELDFQRFLPLPRESVYYDFTQVGHAGRGEGQMHIALAAAQRGVVNGLIGACAAARLKVQEVETAGICLSRALRSLGCDYQTYVFLTEEAGRCALTIFREDLPVVARRLADDLSHAEIAGEAIRSIQFFLTQHREQQINKVCVMSRHAGPLVQELRESLAVRLGQPVLVEPYEPVVDLALGADELAALGAAGRGAGKWQAKLRSN